MKTIRAKLFFSMGILITLLFVVNYFLPKFFVVKDSNQVSESLLDSFEKIENRLSQSIEKWISHYFIQNVSELNTFAKILVESSLPITEKKESLSMMGAQLITYNPSLAYIQLARSSNEILAIAPEDATLYTPKWLPIEDNKLILYFPTHSPSYYMATPLSSSSKYYELEEIEDPQKLTSTFRELKEPTLLVKKIASPEEFYRFLNDRENVLIVKSEMIQKMVNQKETTAIFFMDVEKDTGFALFANELFVSPYEFNKQEEGEELVLLTRQGAEPKLNVALPLEINGVQLYLAFSFSEMANELSGVLDRPILLSDGKMLTILYQYNQKPIPLSQDQLPKNQLFTWENVQYKPYVIKLRDLRITLLTPIAEFDAIPSLMQKLGQQLENKITTNLLVSGFVGLCIALLILSRLSKRITQPIAQLAHAAEEIGRGKYEGVILPQIKGRQDEVATFANSFKNMSVALADREKVHGVLNKVVSTEIATEILKGNVELGGEERVVTLLFSDIRNFTHLSNTLNPKEVIEMLNDYMTTMCHEIDETQGVVDKFVGDEIIALYGAPLEVVHHAEQAVKAAIGMMRALNEWNEKRVQLGKPTLSIGIGLHTGVVCSGNMGAANRLNYTVIGANVNLASRLCAAAKPMQILLSKETKEALVGSYHIVPVEPILFKGFDEPLPIFEIVI